MKVTEGSSSRQEEKPELTAAGMLARHSLAPAKQLENVWKTGMIPSQLLMRDRRRSAVLNNDSLADGATALDAEDDEEDPGDELAGTTDDKAGDSAVEIACGTAGAGVIPVEVVAAVVVPAGRGIAQVSADEGVTDDEHHDGDDEEADGPPFAQFQRLLHWDSGVRQV